MSDKDLSPSNSSSRAGQVARKLFYFAASFVLVLLVEIPLISLVVSDSYSREGPTLGEILFLPVVAGVFIGAFSDQMPFNKNIGKYLDGLVSRQRIGSRVWASLSLIWVVCTVLYLLAFEPYGYRVRDDEWAHFFVVVVSPIAIGAAVLSAIDWSTRSEDPSDKQ